MARKSRRNYNNLENKHEIQNMEIISAPQLLTGVYARLSAEKNSGETIQTQIEMLHQYVREHGEYLLVDTYIDNGYTGTDFERPGFIRMMEDVRTGKIQCIIVKDLSRFGRNFIETGNYIETIFPCLNVRLIAINDDFDSSREEDRNSIITPMKNMINEMYAKDASKKRVLAFEANSKMGNTTKAKSIFGYILDKEENRLKINPETAPIVQAIFRLYQMGRSTGEIVQRMKMLDIMTPYAYKATHEMALKIPDTDRWTGDRVKTILLNQAYIGSTVYGTRKKAKYRNMPEHHIDSKEWIIHENTHDPIITKPDFDEVQEIWNQVSERCKKAHEQGCNKQNDVIDSFPQKVKCMECGKTMRFLRYTNHGQSHGVRKGYYYCVGYDGHPGYCGQKIHEDFLKITVMDQCRNMIRSMCDRRTLLRKMQQGNTDRGELASLRVKTKNMQYKLMQIEETSASLYENFVEGLLDEEEYRMLWEHYVIEKEKLKKSISETEARKRYVEKCIAEFLDIEKNMEKYLDNKSYNQMLVDELVETVIVSANGQIEIRMKCSDVFEEITKIME